MDQLQHKKINNEVVIYHFFEKDHTYIKNFCHFLEFGYRPEIDFVIVVSGSFSIDLPKAPNITYIFTENKNNDYGGYSTALHRLNLIEKYDRFIFINSSVRGPFITPQNFKDKIWTKIFFELLDKDNGLVGSTINILDSNSMISQYYQKLYGGRPPYSHIQTTAYGIMQPILKELFYSGFFNEKTELSKLEVISNYELGLSQQIIKMGHNIKCMLPEYNMIDYREPHKEINYTSINGDMNFKDAYFGRTIHPFEAIFIKTNRGLFLEEYLDRLSASSLINKGINNILHGNTLNEYRNKLINVSTLSERIGFQ